MCTTKQGAFEPTVTLLIMCWRNTGRGDRVSAERGRKKRSRHSVSTVHLAATFPGWNANLSSAVKCSYS